MDMRVQPAEQHAAALAIAGTQLSQQTIDIYSKRKHTGYSFDHPGFESFFAKQVLQQSVINAHQHCISTASL